MLIENVYGKCLLKIQGKNLWELGDRKTFFLVYFQLTTDGLLKRTNFREIANFSTTLQKFIFAK